MKPTLPILAALLLVAIGVGLALSKNWASDDNSNTASAPSSLPGKTNRDATSKISPEAAAKFLRALPDLDLANAPNFDDIESHCRHLSDADLQILIEKVGFSDPGSLLGWLRCALWAELARRDHILAFDLLQRTRLAGADGESSIDAMDQITSSYLRGRITGIEINDATLAELFEEIFILQQRKEGSTGVLNGFGHIFGEWTKHDPAAVWRTIHEDNADGIIPKNLYDALLLEGQEYGYHEFFQNLRNPDDVSKYVKQWAETWNSPPNKVRFEQFTDRQRSRYSGLLMIPESELLAASAAASLARFDPNAAITWLHEAGPPREDGERDSNRDYRFRLSLANLYPETARQWLTDPDRTPHHADLATTLIQNAPQTAPDVISLLSNPDTQSTALSYAITSMSNNRQVDYLPKPGRENRLPDYQGRFDALTEAINTSAIPTDDRTKLHKMLRNEMAKRLPHLP